MGIFACPSSDAEPITGHPYVCNYAGNCNFGYSSKMISMSMVTAPASTLFMYEDNHEDRWCYTNWTNYTSLWTKGLTATWYNEGCNILMADGHAKWMKTSVFSTYADGDTGYTVLYVWQASHGFPTRTTQTNAVT